MNIYLATSQAQLIVEIASAICVTALACLCFLICRSAIGRGSRFDGLYAVLFVIFGVVTILLSTHTTDDLWLFARTWGVMLLGLVLLIVHATKPKRPNQASEPTTMAVTIRAPSSTARASHGRGSS
jgi:hypothetical protein